ncbi:MAG TPA: multifunctional CCA tRNA nucleotidyl transferase/2'3'-cyclic phosphodiesterase/2'nucleotidase/phosphatase [bacterium]|nr:multifunctional CCA tRNA nucleotidyl transferase/2'3'-cyclic phosphodiesterase/2'nucleotidase/phosphatase [bacterium]
MKIYQVGGSVRDEILGIQKSADRDFVVVNATVEEFLNAFPNAKKVGANFPVFLVNGEEYAFARKEKKVSPGHKGFDIISDPEVTLEEDLKRRDITINAIAKDIETGELIDPCGGLKDIKNKKIVHITDAFAEDPLRVYRVARFSAVLNDFSVDPSTIGLMNSLKKELYEISVERVWGECVKALSAGDPSKFFELLKESKVLDIHFTELNDLIGVPAGPAEYHPGEIDTFDHTMKSLRRISGKTKGTDPMLAFSVLCHDLGKGLTSPENYPHHYDHDKAGIESVENFCKKLKTPSSYLKCGVMASKYHLVAAKIKEMRPAKAVKLLSELKHFPAGSIKGFLRLIYADSGEGTETLSSYIDKVLPALDEKLPEKWKDMGEKSGEILLQIKAEKYKELKDNIISGEK